jgi:hypothetical protein
MNLLPLVNLLESESLGVQGNNLFVDMLPSEAARAILLRNPLVGTPINHEMPGYYKADFQLIVRVPAGSYDAGSDLIKQVTRALHFEERTIEDMHFKYCRPRTLPVVFPLSEGNLLEFSVMVDCCFSEEAL